MWCPSELQQRSLTPWIPGLLADSLPDKYGNQLIETWLAQNGRPHNSMNPVEKLCFVGSKPADVKHKWKPQKYK